MAGMIVTIGPDAKAKHEKCYSSFCNQKHLPLTCNETSQSFCVSKFGRGNETDRNVFKNETLKLWVVGTLLYKRNFGERALIDLVGDLKHKQVREIVNDLDGPFCFVIQNPKLQKIWIITDHAGIMNMYRYKTEDGLIISSSASTLSRLFTVNINRGAVSQFLRTGSICDPETIYNEIELLDAATIYEIDYEPEFRLVSKTRYWKSPISIDEGLSFEEARDRIADSLVERMEIFSHENLICDFTAGFDSRIIASTLTKVRDSTEGGLYTFVFGPPLSNEVKLVRDISERLFFKNHHLELPDDWAQRFPNYVLNSFALSDGEENICNYAPILLANEYKKSKHSIAFNGLGGELYRDFWWLQEVVYSKKPANYKRLVETRVLQYEYDYSIFSDEWRNWLHSVNELLKQKYIDTNKDMDFYKTYNTLQIDNIYFRQKIRRWAGRTISTTNQIIPAVAPLTLKKCLEAGMSSPPKYKRNGRLVRAVIEKLYPELAKMRMLNGTPCQNIRVVNLYKFYPLLPELIKRGLRKVSQKALKKTILVDKTLTYPTDSWYTNLISDPKLMNSFQYNEMHTKKLFNQRELETFFRDAKEPGFPYYFQLGNILTLELRLRSDNSMKGMLI